MFEQNLAAKRRDPVFTADMTPLLAHGHLWNFEDAFERVWSDLVARLPGTRGRGDVVAEPSAKGCWNEWTPPRPSDAFPAGKRRQWILSRCGGGSYDWLVRAGRASPMGSPSQRAPLGK
jgi:hypothetical protein